MREKHCQLIEKIQFIRQANMTIIVSDKKNTPAEKHISYQDESFKERILHQTHVASFFFGALDFDRAVRNWT
jgi:hypothetical protein